MAHVAAEPPPGWVATDIATPKIAESAGATVTEWAATRSPDGGAALVSGCVATPIPGWVEDMRPAVEGRTTALAGASAERITGVPMDARPSGQSGLVLRAASDLGGPIIGTARTFVGFDDARVVTCFAVCAARNPLLRSGTLGCERSATEARLEGSTAPPPPGLALRGVTWAVHSPRPAALGGAVLVVAAGVLAVVTRRRPRSASQRLQKEP